MTATAIVTGAARGLGRALSIELARGGSAVHGLDRDAEGLEETGRLCRAHGAEFTGTLVDLTDEHRRREVFDGLPAADLAIANAGILEISGALDVSTDSLMRMLVINTVATYEFLQSTAKAMIASGRPGRLLVIASDAALRGMPAITGYVGSKHAIAGLARSLEIELAGTDVRLTTAYPGAMATTLSGPEAATRGAMNPEEVAATLLAPFGSAFPTVHLREVHLAPRGAQAADG